MIGDRIINSLRNMDPRLAVRIWKIALFCMAAPALLIPGAIYMGWLRIPPIPFFNGMAIQIKGTTQAENPFLPGRMEYQPTVRGSLPRMVQPYPLPATPDPDGNVLKNPLPVTVANMNRGGVLFDTYCQPCHGYRAAGDGSATGAGRMPSPPSLHSKKVKEWPDGRIYHVITTGQNRMSSYADATMPADRWAIILYLRALQRALSPLPEDLPASRQAPKQPAPSKATPAVHQGHEGHGDQK